MIKHSSIGLSLYIILFLNPTYSFASDIYEITVYNKICMDGFVNFHCPGEWYISKDEYKVFLREQRVIEKFAYSLGDCVVYDKENWKCTSYDSRTSMEKGRISRWYKDSTDSIESPYKVDKRTMQLNFMEYYLNKLSE